MPLPVNKRPAACLALGLLFVSCLAVVPWAGFLNSHLCSHPPAAASPPAAGSGSLKAAASPQGASLIDMNYIRVRDTPGDINEHIPTIESLAREGSTAAELGVRGVVSTYALLRGLRDSKTQGPKRLMCLDYQPIPDLPMLISEAAAEGVEVTGVQGDSATYRLPFPVDLLLIDTWHVYAHLARELAQHHAHVFKYILLHDTETDGEEGESLRNQEAVEHWMEGTIEEQAAKFGYPVEEVARGMQPAIDEFLAAHKGEWVLHMHYVHNNGLTVLRRIKPPKRTRLGSAGAGADKQ